MGNSLRQDREDIRAILDQALCSRVGAALAAFQRSFDAAAAHPTPGALDELREATDQLMRAASRMLLELSREEARHL